MHRGGDEDGHGSRNAVITGRARNLSPLERALLLVNRSCSKLVAGTAFVVLFCRQDSVTAGITAGALIDAFLGKALKRLLAISRPATSAKQSHGMPSSHANSLSYWAGVLSLTMYTSWIRTPLTTFLYATQAHDHIIDLPIRPAKLFTTCLELLYTASNCALPAALPSSLPPSATSPNLSTLTLCSSARSLQQNVRILVVLSLLMYLYASAVCYTRVYLTKDHTLAQVSVGATLGTAFSVAWFYYIIEPIMLTGTLPQLFS